MVKEKIKNLNLYKFEFVEKFPFVEAAFFGRFGGVSGTEKNELNLAFHEEDPTENVLANMKRAEESLNLKNSFFVKQTHSKNIYFLKQDENYKIKSPLDVPQNYDAIVTKALNVPLLIKIADCQGILLLEPNLKILAVVHNGWRGSVKNIIKTTVNFLINNFNVQPENLWAGLGPSLGPCCAEFKNYKEELPESFWAFKKGNYFNFWALSQNQLEKAGLKKDKIEIMEICTKCHEDFFSYRRGDKNNRFGIMAALKE